MSVLLTLGAIGLALLLIRLWTGVMNVGTIEEQSLAVIERRHPYLPRGGTSLLVIGITVASLLISAFYYRGLAEQFFVVDQTSITRTVIVFLAIIGFGVFDQWRWKGAKDRSRYLFAFLLGTIVTWILIGFKRAFFETGIHSDPFLMALGITCVVLGWRFLFGPWNASIKATVLGTFIFWVAYAVLRFKSEQELIATGIAALVALIPVVVWCVLFLAQHRERLSIVFLAFFAGMLSTVPILFYDALLKRSIELNFFFFKIVLLDFAGASNDFVRGGALAKVDGVQSMVFATLITYLLVGTIEEISKYWVFRHSGKAFLRSIDDALELAIIVALGFAFAENLENPSYFVGFVSQYLLAPASPEWGLFLGNVFGRAVLTTMVHVLSTGVMGYFFGLAFFATPLLREQFARGSLHPIVQSIHHLLSVRSEEIYAQTRMLQGVLAAIALHGVFDFVVTLPEILPGNPATIGDLLRLSSDSFLHSISIILLPAILYVVGGFWLLTYLFARKDDLKEFGNVVMTPTVISAPVAV